MRKNYIRAFFLFSVYAHCSAGEYSLHFTMKKAPAGSAVVFEDGSVAAVDTNEKKIVLANEKNKKECRSPVMLTNARFSADKEYLINENSFISTSNLRNCLDEISFTNLQKGNVAPAAAYPALFIADINKNTQLIVKLKMVSYGPPADYEPIIHTLNNHTPFIEAIKTNKTQTIGFIYSAPPFFSSDGKILTVSDNTNCEKFSAKSYQVDLIKRLFSLAIPATIQCKSTWASEWAFFHQVNSEDYLEIAHRTKNKRFFPLGKYRSAFYEISANGDFLLQQIVDYSKSTSLINIYRWSE